MGWPHTLRPKGCSAISSGVQATYQAFFGYMFVSPVVGQNLPSALYARFCKSPRRLYTQETGTTDISALDTAQALFLRSAACSAGFERPDTSALPNEVVIKTIANGALFISIGA